MNRYQLLPSLLVIVISLLCSCTDDSSCDPQPQFAEPLHRQTHFDDAKVTPAVHNEFEGKWSWVETTFGWSPPLNPEKLGHSLSLILDHNTYTWYVDGGFSQQWKYEFKSELNHFGSTIDFIVLDSGHRYNVYVDSLNLRLSSPWNDGDTWYYVRQ